MMGIVFLLTKISTVISVSSFITLYKHLLHYMHLAVLVFSKSLVLCTTIQHWNIGTTYRLHGILQTALSVHYSKMLVHCFYQVLHFWDWYILWLTWAQIQTKCSITLSAQIPSKLYCQWSSKNNSRITFMTGRQFYKYKIFLSIL